MMEKELSLRSEATALAGLNPYPTLGDLRQIFLNPHPHSPLLTLWAVIIYYIKLFVNNNVETFCK